MSFVRLIFQFAKYNSPYYRPHIESVCVAFRCSDLIRSNRFSTTCSIREINLKSDFDEKRRWLLENFWPMGPNENDGKTYESEV